jgi:hypothetical protein
MLEAVYAVHATIDMMKNPHAVALGRLGGLKGGPIGGRARAAALSPSERTAIARRAAGVRWGKKPQLPTVDQVRGWLAETGAPLLRGDISSAHRGEMALDELAMHAVRVAPQDASLTRALPVFLWRNRSRLDLAALGRMARRAGQSRTIGFFLDLTAELSGDRSFRLAAEDLRPSRSLRNTLFFRSSTSSSFARQAAERNTPAVARRWGLLMNMPLDSFQTLFDKFARTDEASRAS